MTYNSKLLITLPIALLLSASRCVPSHEPAEGCTGSEDCGTTADCSAFCATIERLGCSEQWGIDGADGACLELCETASPGVCPRLAGKQATCEAVDKASECGR
jgi:hypothetical protein